MNIKRLYRKAIFEWRLWRMHRQLPRPHKEIMRELDDAKRGHRRTSHIYEKLRKSAHQGLRA